MPKSDRGQAIVEMMIVLPLIIVFIMVVVDLGLLLDRREVVQHGVREGARAAAVGKTTTEIADITVNQSKGLFDPGDISICYVDRDANGITGNAGDGVRVSGTYTYDYILGSGGMGMGLSIPGLTMTPSAEARLETSVLSGARC